MKITEFFKEVLRIYFIVFSGSMLGATLFLNIFGIKYIPTYVLWQMMILSLGSALISLIFFSERELGKRELLIRKNVHFLGNFTLWILGAYFCRWFSFADFKFISYFAVQLLVLYLIIMTVSHFIYCSQAKQLNQKLTEYQKRRSRDHE